MIKKIIIYVLICPFTFKIRYVGRTSTSIKQRLQGHISKSYDKNTPKDNWIQKLLRLNKKPIIKIFKIVNTTWENSHIIEQNLIRKCLQYNFNLTNLEDKGIGGNHILTEIQKQNLSKKLKERYDNGMEIKENFRSVSLYDMEGSFINSFSSIKKCAEFINPTNIIAGVSALEKCLSKKCTNSKSYKKYQITYSEDSAPSTYHKNDFKRSITVFDNLTNNTYIFDSIINMSKFLHTQHNAVKKFFNNILLFQGRYKLTVPQR